MSVLSLSLTAVPSVTHFWVVGSPSIIRKFIFSFNNLQLLFPFTDGVTNYFIIGFLKTSYFLFGSISKTSMCLSFISMVGYREKSPMGEYLRILSRFYIYYSKVVYIGADLVLFCSIFLLRKCSLPIILFHSAESPRTLSYFPFGLEPKKRTPQW